MSENIGLASLGFDAVLFDLDGVVTRTAEVHAAAWAQLFDDFLSRQAGPSGEPLRPFDPADDYLTYVDGKPRYEGVRSFLAARGITLPEGNPTDGAEAETATVWAGGRTRSSCTGSAAMGCRSSRRRSRSSAPSASGESKPLS